MPHASVSQQLLHKYRLDIIGGKYPPGSQFPTVRALAYEESVNPNTMQKSLALLEEEGLLYSKGTVGRFVTSDSAILFTAKERMKKNCVNVGKLMM